MGDKEIPKKPDSPEEKKLPQDVQDNMLLREVERGWRKIEGTEWGVIRIYNDTLPAIQQKSEEAYAGTYGSLLANPDFKTYDEIERELIRRGVWDDEKSGLIDEKIEEIRDTVKEGRGLTGEKKKEHEQALEKLYGEYTELILQKQRKFSAAIEVQADIARRMMQIYLSVRKDPGDDDKTYKDCEPVWENLDALKEDHNFRFVQAQCNRFWSGLEAGEDFFGAWLDEAMSKQHGNTAKQ